MIAFTAIYLSVYIIITTILLGWQTSISNTYKDLPSNFKWVFVIFMYGLAALCMAIGKNNTMVIMGFGCIFVGSFPRFYDDQNVQHYIGAAVIIGAGMWQVGVVLKLWYFPVIFVLISLPLLKVRNRIFWVEIAAFLTIIIGLWISIG